MGTRPNQKTGRRRRRSGEEIERLVAELEASRLTLGQFARKHRVSTATVGNWQRRVRKRRAQSGSDPAPVPVEFVQIDLEGANLGRSPAGNPAPAPAPGSCPPGGFALVLAPPMANPSEPAVPVHMVQIAPGFDPEHLTRLLRVLGVALAAPSSPRISTDNATTSKGQS